MGLSINGEYIDDQVLRAEARVVRQEIATEFVGSPLELDLKASEISRDRIIDGVLLRQAASQVQPLMEVNQPARSKVVEFYRENKNAFYAPERVRVAQVFKVVDEFTDEGLALAKIQLAFSEICQGRSFSSVADEHSDCPGQGGDLGWVIAGEMVEEFETVVFALNPGQTSSVFRSPFGWHIAKVMEHRKAGIRVLSEIYAEVQEALMESQRREVIARLLTDLRTKADIRRVAIGAEEWSDGSRSDY